MKKIIAYIRVSTDEQAESGLGLEAQRAAIRAAIGGEPDAWYHDDLPGKRADRPGLLAALDALQRGDTLIVAKRDRLAREVYLSAWIDKEVTRKRATCISAAGEGTDGDDPASELMRHIIDAFAHYERQVIGVRTRAALQVKRACGERVGTLPWGYQLAADGVHLTPDDTEQAISAFAHARHATGASLVDIANGLNALGYQTRAGKPWHRVAVHRLLARAA
jgi:DNA invertase Pin-like site-specific DNA recombinase